MRARLAFPFLIVVSCVHAPDLTYAPSTLVPLDLSPSAVALADKNGDGALDIIAIGDDAGAPSLVVAFGDGHGAFRATKSERTCMQAQLVVTADFDGDGALDVALAGHDSNVVELRMSRAEKGAISAFDDNVKPHTHGLAAGDVDGDGDVDVTIAHQEIGAVGVLLNDGGGAFTRANALRIGTGFYPHALADVDGDGDLDIVAPDIIGSAIVVAKNDGHASFVSKAIGVKPRPFFVLLGDVNGDGALDIIATHDDIDDADVFMNDGTGAFTLERTLHTGFLAWSIALDRGALLFIGGGKIARFERASDGQWRNAGVRDTSTGAFLFAIGDVDGDRTLDVVVPDRETRGVRVLRALRQ